MKRLLIAGMSIAMMIGCAPQTELEVVGDQILLSLSGQPGNPSDGKQLFETRRDAHCVLCHAHEKSDVPFQGDLGPELTNIADRLNPAQIRLRIADYDQVKPGTTMPSYFKRGGLQQVLTEYDGETVLTGQEIEDIIAFLMEGANGT